VGTARRIDHLSVLAGGTRRGAGAQEARRGGRGGAWDGEDDVGRGFGEAERERESERRNLRSESGREESVRGTGGWRSSLFST
jgi:hypothetical protein